LLASNDGKRGTAQNVAAAIGPAIQSLQQGRQSGLNAQRAKHGARAEQLQQQYDNAISEAKFNDLALHREGQREDADQSRGLTSQNQQFTQDFKVLKELNLEANRDNVLKMQNHRLELDKAKEERAVAASQRKAEMERFANTDTDLKALEVFEQAEAFETSLLDNIRYLKEDEGTFFKAPRLNLVYGLADSRHPESLRGPAAMNSTITIRNLVDSIALLERGKLEGQGQISDFEFKALKAAATRLQDERLSDKEAMKELGKIESLLMTKQASRNDQMSHYRSRTNPDKEDTLEFLGYE